MILELSSLRGTQIQTKARYVTTEIILGLIGTNVAICTTRLEILGSYDIVVDGYHFQFTWNTQLDNSHMQLHM